MNDFHGKILRLSPNRVWRTYSGGLMLDRMEGKAEPQDGTFPEDWIGSTVRAINPAVSRRSAPVNACWRTHRASSVRQDGFTGLDFSPSRTRRGHQPSVYGNGHVHC